MRQSGLAGFAVAVNLALAGSGVLAQEPDEDALRSGRVAVAQPETFKVCPGVETATPEKILNQYAKVTGKRFIYNPRVFGQCSMELKGSGDTTFHRSQADLIFQGILRHNGLALVPLMARGQATYSVEVIDSSRILKANAQSIAMKDIARAEERPAEVFMTVIPLKHVPVSHVRQALQNVITSRTAEFIQETTGANALMVCGFGTTLANVARIVRMVDIEIPQEISRSAPRASPRVGSPGRPKRSTARRGGASKRGKASTRKPQLSMVALEHAPASEDLARIVASSVGGSLRVIPDPRTNSVILSGTKSDLEKGQQVLGMLDVPVKKK